MAELLKYVDSYKVVVCIPCTTGLPLKEIPYHLRNQHPSVGPDERARIIGTFEDLPGVTPDTVFTVLDARDERKNDD